MFGIYGSHTENLLYLHKKLVPFNTQYKYKRTKPNVTFQSITFDNTPLTMNDGSVLSLRPRQVNHQKTFSFCFMLEVNASSQHSKSTCKLMTRVRSMSQYVFEDFRRAHKTSSPNFYSFCPGLYCLRDEIFAKVD